MRVIFVGIHNKPNLPPLCSGTKTGRIVDRIIDELVHVETVKTNLFEVDFLPISIDRPRLIRHWFEKYNPRELDFVILFGKKVEKYFPSDQCVGCDVLSFAHPASKFGKDSQEEYINEILNTIRKLEPKVVL